MARREARTSRSVWADQGTEYNPDAPAVVSALRGEKWKRRALHTIVWVITPLCLLIVLGIIAGNTNDELPTDLTGVSVESNASPGKAAAFTAMQAWLNSSPSPLPGGSIITWNGYTVENAPASDPTQTASSPTYRFETHTFVLARASQLYSASLQVVVDGDAIAMPSTTPDLTPIINGTSDAQILPWFGLPIASAPQAVDDAMNAWARAFTSGDGEELRRVLQDKDPDRTYVPLTGVSSVSSTSIIAAAEVPTGDENQVPTQMLIRIELSIWWDGEEPSDQTQSGPAPMTYDLLIDDANTAAPFVIAWGPAGSGPSLTAYVNGLTGVDLTQSPTTGPEPTPSSTPGGG